MPRLTTPFDELVNNFADLVRKHGTNYAKNQAKQVAKIPYALFRGITTQFYKTVSDKIDTAYKQGVKIGTQFVNGSHIRIDIDTARIAAERSSEPTLIPVKIKFSRGAKLLPFSTGFQETEVDGYVAYQWNRLGKFHEKTINIIDYLPLFLPHQQKGISQGPLGLVTFQNGIRNDHKNDFLNRCKQVLAQFPEGQLFIGLHNPITSLPLSLGRFTSEELFNTPAVYSLCQTFYTFAEKLAELNPNLIWTHFAHSEGGLIGHVALDLMHKSGNNNITKYLREHLVTATYGAVKPIPTNHVLRAINTYSDHDIALTFGQNYLDKPLEEIKVKPYKSTKKVDEKTYHLTIVGSTTIPNDPIKFKLEMPPIKTLEERLNMSMWEWLAQLEHVESSRHLEYEMVNTPTKTINGITYAVTDHGFIEATYKDALKSNVTLLKNLYQKQKPTFKNYQK